MYKVIASISTIIRQFYLENPFRGYFKNDYLYFNSEIIADIFNFWVGESLLHLSSFILASSLYEKEQMPSIIGSISYLLSYIFNTIIMTKLCIMLDNLNIEFIILIYILIDVIVYAIINKIKRKVT